MTSIVTYFHKPYNGLTVADMLPGRVYRALDKTDGDCEALLAVPNEWVGVLKGKKLKRSLYFPHNGPSRLLIRLDDNATDERGGRGVAIVSWELTEPVTEVDIEIKATVL